MSLRLSASALAAALLAATVAAAPASAASGPKWEVCVKQDGGYLAEIRSQAWYTTGEEAPELPSGYVVTGQTRCQGYDDTYRGALITVQAFGGFEKSCNIDFTKLPPGRVTLVATGAIFDVKLTCPQ